MKIAFLFPLLCAALSAQTAGAPPDTVNPVVAWNRTLLAMVRTAGVQPATVHPTRNFAILHAAIYDAVNAIDRTHRFYFARHVDVDPDASQEAAANAAAREVLVTLYPAQHVSLD